MIRIEQIMAHPLYIEAMAGIQDAERDRTFCRHGLEHCLDVARILYIMVLEQHLDYDKEVIYATALLHDIGRYEEYMHEISHHEAGIRLAGEILGDCDFAQDEKTMILQAIGDHKEYDAKGQEFSRLLYQADKRCRGCYACKARKDCYWEEERKNSTIIY